MQNVTALKMMLETFLQKTKPTATNEVSEANSTNKPDTFDKTEIQKPIIIDHTNDDVAQIIKRNESFDEIKNTSKIPVWTGLTIKNKNEEAARLEYLNSDINRSRIPRFCVSITKGW